MRQLRGVTSAGPVTRRSSGKLTVSALLAASGLSMYGNVLTMVAVPWFVLETTGSASKTGLVAGAVAFAAVVSGLFGGPLIDSLGFKRTSVGADVASGLTVAAVPVLYQTVGLNFWALLALVFVGAVLDTPGQTARQSLIPELASRASVPVERVNSASQALWRLSLLLGPASGGVLVAALGATNVLWLNTVTFAASALILLVALPRATGGVPHRQPQREAQQEAEKDLPASGTTSGGYFDELARGLRFIRQNGLVLSIIAIAVAVNLLVNPLVSVVTPVYASEVFGSPVDYGLMLAGFGGGALLGTLLYGAFGHVLPRRATYVLSCAVSGLPIWLLVATPPLPISVGVLVIIGLGIGPANPLLFTVIQEESPAAMRGRVLGAFTSLATAAAPAGMLAAGYSLDALGLEATLILVAGIYTFVVIVSALNPVLSRMDDGRP